MSEQRTYIDAIKLLEEEIDERGGKQADSIRLARRVLLSDIECDICGGKIIDRVGDTLICENKRSPNSGGCWICNHGNGEEDEDMSFDMEFDTWYHDECLPEGINSILEFERQRKEEHTLEWQ